MKFGLLSLRNRQQLVQQVRLLANARGTPQCLVTVPWVSDPQLTGTFADSPACVLSVPLLLRLLQ
jgi:hypothetical protein